MNRLHVVTSDEVSERDRVLGLHREMATLKHDYRAERVRVWLLVVGLPLLALLVAIQLLMAAYVLFVLSMTLTAIAYMFGATR